MTGGYRADIDGLRAISVLAVMLFHAELGVPGGYVGVDVFFVISGYLISGIILEDIGRGRFSMPSFWERRIRRIWPAALVVTASVLAAGWVLMTPLDYRTLAADAIAQVLMLANVRCWMGTDYFSPSSDLSPLLHMWSLAVEEQFYIVFPPLLLVISRWSRRGQSVLLSSLMLASFCASAFLLHRSPQAVFYLLPFRAWELLLGAWLSVHRRSRPLSTLASDLLALTGLALIALPAFLYGRTTAFPGIAALPACAGAAVVLAAGQGPPGLVLRALGCAPMRAIGLISYSLYLWHWPVLAFLRYRWGHELPSLTLAIAVVITFPVAACSYWAVEQPARRGLRSWTFRRVAAVAGAASLALLGVAALLRASSGAPWRVDPGVASFYRSQIMPVEWEHPSDAPVDVMKSVGMRPGHSGDPCFLLWGDSHGMVLSKSIHELARSQGVAGRVLLRRNRPPTLGVIRPNAPGNTSASPFPGTPDEDDRIIGWIEAHRPRHIILCARWSMYLSDRNPDAGGAQCIAWREDPTASPSMAFDRSLSALLGLADRLGSRVWLLLEAPFQAGGPQRRAIDAMHDGGTVRLDGVSADQHRWRCEPVLDVVARPHLGRIRVVDLGAPFFDGRGISKVGRQGESWYFDDDHLSQAGVDDVLMQPLAAMMAEIARDCGHGVQEPGTAPGSVPP